jgi:hypothetical protein
MAQTRRRGPEDRTRINLSEHYEIDFWTSRFDCTEAELRDAVNRLGTCAHVVKTFLRNRAEPAHDHVGRRLSVREIRR